MRKAAYFILLIILCSAPILLAQSGNEKATFAGGCFWCMEPPFEVLDGVISVTSGFTGGETMASYSEVSSGKTQHVEAVEIVYDPSKVSYEQLLQVYWKNIDPTDAEGQFCDRGAQYRPAIFYHNEKQKTLAEQSRIEAGKKLKKAIDTPIVPASKFFAADASHQDFYKKNALRYKQYKIQCQRDRKLKEIWGKVEQAKKEGE